MQPSTLISLKDYSPENMGINKSYTYTYKRFFNIKTISILGWINEGCVLCTIKL